MLFSNRIIDTAFTFRNKAGRQIKTYASTLKIIWIYYSCKIHQLYYKSQA
jgi:hypothetical protein